jgi:hypothetical protein
MEDERGGIWQMNPGRPYASIETTDEQKVKWGLAYIRGKFPARRVAVQAVLPDEEVAARLVSDAYVDGVITLLDVERTATTCARSPVVARMVARGWMLPFPTEPVFVYWGATTIECWTCEQVKLISRVHVRNVHRQQLVDDPGSISHHCMVTPAMCWDCIRELQDLGMITR